MEKPTFGFHREKIMEYTSSLDSYEEQIEYLTDIKYEYQTNPPGIDPNIRAKISFIDFIAIQIEHLNLVVAKLEESAKEDDELCRIIGDRKNVVRIFEAMKKNDIIDSNTPPKFIVNIFFKDKEQLRKNSQYYSNRKKELNDLGMKTNSSELIMFTKTLIKDSFEGNKEILRDLREYTSQLLKA